MVDAAVDERVRAVLAKAPVIDGHNDFPWQMRKRTRYDLAGLDITTDQSATGLHTDLARMRAGGMGAQFWSVYVPCTLAGEAAVTATLEQIDFVHQMVERYPEHLVLARTAADVEAAHAAGKIASLIGVEGGHSIGCSLGTLRMLYAVGARYMTLTHTSNTPWADSGTDDPGVGGLSDFGREVVRECNRLGIMADLSHVAPSTMHATLDVSTAPAFFSHSSARAVCDHPRNVPDDVLTRVRDTQGVVMVTFVPGFLNDACHQWLDALMTLEKDLGVAHGMDTPDFDAARDAWVADNPVPVSTTKDIADHMEHVRDVAGIDSVGIGGDFDGIEETPVDATDVTAYPKVLAELAGRGWSDADLAKLTWGNALRVLRDTEAAARAARAERGPSLAVFS